MSEKVEYLKMIQEIIKRLSQNSFLLKGWSVFLTSALIAFLARGGKPTGLLFACIPVLIFWGLDGYFLHQERLFKKLYDQVRKLPCEKIDFSMERDKVSCIVELPRFGGVFRACVPSL